MYSLSVLLSCFIYKTLFLKNFIFSLDFPFKVTFGYIGESPENFMSKYTQEVWVFWE